MIAALGAKEQITESIVKLSAARRNLEHAIVFGELAEVAVPTLTIISDVVRALEFVEVAP
jgi:hypothetical protein